MMNADQTLREHLRQSAEQYGLRFPEDAIESNLDQDEEWCELQLNGTWKRLRLHDYAEIYNIPGLYEKLFHRSLRCNSPRRVAELFADVLRDWPKDEQPRHLLDVGAGGGMVAEKIMEHTSVQHAIGIDLIPEAKQSAMRDRPWVYDDYFVTDLCELPEKVERQVRRFRPDTLSVIAALGFGDIPTRAFLTALDVIETPGWIAFNIKENFLQHSDGSGFAGLIHRLRSDNIIRVEAFRRYCHRINIFGQPLHYVAMIARKHRNLPDDYLD